MSHTRHLDLCSQGPALVLDAGGQQTWVGLMRDRGWVSFESSPEPALESLFPMVRTMLADAGCRLEDLQSFVFCDGPGSILGLRIAATAVLTWQHLADLHLPVFHYHSLELTRRHLCESGAEPSGVVFTDFRRQCWLATPLDRPGEIHELSSQDLADFPADQRYYLPQRRGWITPPVEHREVAYPFTGLPQRIAEHGFGVVRAAPVLALPGKNDYQRWSARRHRAPQAHE